MPDSGNQSPTPGELSRTVRDVLGRFEALANKLDVQFVNKDIFKLYSDGVARELEHLIKGQEQRDAQLEQRIQKLENNITWVVRIVIGAVVLAVLAAIGISRIGSGGGGG